MKVSTTPLWPLVEMVDGTNASGSVSSLANTTPIPNRVIFQFRSPSDQDLSPGDTWECVKRRRQISHRGQFKLASAPAFSKTMTRQL